MFDEHDGSVRQFDPYQPAVSGPLSLRRLLRLTLMLPPGRRPGLKLIGVVIALYHSFYSAGYALRRVDERLWPDCVDQEVDQPLYIIANPRSGTTFLHCLMSLDEERFATHKLYQTLLPSVSTYKLAELASRFDQKATGGRLSRLVERFDDLVMPFWDNIHPIGLRHTEEDEALFVFQRASISLCLLTSLIEELRPAILLDHWADEERQRVVEFYRECIQRHVFAKGGRRFLGKNVLASGRIGTILEAFPNARIIYLVRHPYEAIPSFVSMFSAPWPHHSPEIGERALEHRQLAGIAIAMYRHAFAMYRSLPSERMMAIRYQDLVAAPIDTVERIYAHFGMQITPGFAAKLRNEVQRSQSYRSSHNYSLEGYGLTREEIYEALKDVFDFYGFEP